MTTRWEVLLVVLVLAGGEEKPLSVAPIGAEPKAVVLFTHLRRCGGTFIEDALLKPMVGSQASATVCKEGGLARHHDVDDELRADFKRILAQSGLVWRHCPYGIHELLPVTRPYVYVTMLRAAAPRMASWFAYCDKYSPNKCRTNPRAIAAEVQAGASRMTGFYRVRKARLKALGRPGRLKMAEIFHPDWLEYALDDNYATRMICGGATHAQPPPVDNAALACARRHLEADYAIVGTLERRDDSLCVLANVLGIPRGSYERALKAASASLKFRGPTTEARAKVLPADFLSEFQGYLHLDDHLHETAELILNRHMQRLPQCTAPS